MLSCEPKLLARFQHRWRQAQEFIQQVFTIRILMLIVATVVCWGSGTIIHKSTCRHDASRWADRTSFLAGSVPAVATRQLQHLYSDVPGYSPPYIVPKLIHQTVEDRSSMSCQARESIQTWIDMNPGYTHKLYDAKDRVAFVREHYPQLLDVFLALPTNVERADTWRYLALYKLGGVYADSDVKCMQPVDTWNAEHHHDAALMVGIAKRTRHGVTQEFNQFVMASMPGHPVMGSMPGIIASNFAASFLRGAAPSHSGLVHDIGVLSRTGPGAFTQAVRLYAQRVGQHWPINSTRADLLGGIRFGTVRAMPKFVFGMGWETVDYNMTCDEVKHKVRPQAYVCHQFFGTWKQRPENSVNLTYTGCRTGLQYSDHSGWSLGSSSGSSRVAMKVSTAQSQ